MITLITIILTFIIIVLHPYTVLFLTRLTSVSRKRGWDVLAKKNSPSPKREGDVAQQDNK